MIDDYRESFETNKQTKKYDNRVVHIHQSHITEYDQNNNNKTYN